MSARLTGRERILRSIERKDLDRIPVFFRAESTLKEKIKKELKLKDEKEIISYFGSDAIHIYISYKDDFIKSPDKDGFFEDLIGNKFQVIHSDKGDVSRIIKPVLNESEKIDEIYSMKWPDKNIVNLQKCIQHAKLARETTLAVYGGMWATLFTQARAMMGEEHFLVSLVMNPEFVEALIHRLTDFYLEVNELYFSACAEYLDIFYFGSDFGTQNSMFISKEMFRRFFKPGLKRLVEHAKGYGLKTMYHTCGSVSEIISDLIECGFDILDPIQVSAANMQPEFIAQKFKNKIAFHGGISSQVTLPFGTSEDVKNDVVSTIEALGPLGYIVSSDQDMIGDIPIENIETMFRTAREYKII